MWRNIMTIWQMLISTVWPTAEIMHQILLKGASVYIKTMCSIVTEPSENSKNGKPSETSEPCETDQLFMIHVHGNWDLKMDRLIVHRGILLLIISESNFGNSPILHHSCTSGQRGWEDFVANQFQVNFRNSPVPHHSCTSGRRGWDCAQFSI